LQKFVEVDGRNRIRSLCSARRASVDADDTEVARRADDEEELLKGLEAGTAEETAEEGIAAAGIFAGKISDELIVNGRTFVRPLLLLAFFVVYDGPGRGRGGFRVAVSRFDRGDGSRFRATCGRDSENGNAPLARKAVIRWRYWRRTPGNAGRDRFRSPAPRACPARPAGQSSRQA